MDIYYLLLYCTPELLLTPFMIFLIVKIYNLSLTPFTPHRLRSHVPL